MKKTLLALFLLTACSRAATTTTPATTGPDRSTASPSRSTNLTGGSTPRAAVEQFLNAVRAEDIQAMSVIFGTSRGPSRDNMNRQELEKRLIILQCHFNHDKFRILGETSGEGGHRVIASELTRGTSVRRPRFYVIAGPGDRFYVDNMEIAAVRDFCRP